MDSGQSATIGDGRYAVDRRVGVGGCGAVYLAYDTVLNRWVAIKQIETAYGISDPFLEARQLASLQHPNIVTIYDFFRSEGQTFVVMEYIPGQNINELTDPMELDFFATFARQCLEALAAAHEIGLVHRDIKPANIMLAPTPSGGFQAKLLDFGLAKVMSEPSQQTMDHSGAITGSIHTISPEQLSRLPMDHRADLYSLGCVFYKALTLKFPFHGDDVPSLIAAHLQHDFTPLSEARPDLPSTLTAWVEKLFAFNKDDRPQSASEALQSLEPSTKTPAPNKRPDLRGKPSLANPLTSPTPPPPKKTKPNPPAEVDESPTSRATPFHRSQNFVIAMAAVIAVCATLAILALTGNFGGGTSRPSPFAKKEKPTPTPAEKTSFKSSDRGEIKDKVGKQITVTGVIDRLEHGEKSRYLVFAESDPRSGVMVSYDPAKSEISEWMLKRKFVGQKVRANGTVKLDGSRLLLEISSMDDLTLHADESPASK
jgi:serine/threonine-protein kinase